MGFGKNILDAIVIGAFTYAGIAGVNLAGIPVFPGLMNEFGLFVWFLVAFMEISVARL